MYNMIFDCLRIYQDVVLEDNDKVVQVVNKYVIHQVHKLCRGIGDSKRNNKELVQAPTSFEHYLRNILFLERYLPIARSKIDAIVHCGAPQTVK